MTSATNPRAPCRRSRNSITRRGVSRKTTTAATRFLALCAAIFASACSDAALPTAPAGARPEAAASLNNGSFRGEKFVAIGTSISMGWASNGVYAGSQLLAWPELLSFGALRPISLPLIQSPGCWSPLVAPLGANKRLSGEPFSGSTVCAPNVAGVTLPTQDVALAGALTIDALQTTPTNAPADQIWYPRVLPAGATQVTAALGQVPSFISIELGGNDVLFTTGGLVVPGVTFTPFPLFAAAYDAVLNAVGSANAKELLVALPTDGRKLPALRRGDEIWADRAEFAALHVGVDHDCAGSPNFINVSVKALVEVFTAAFTSANGLPNPVFSCADIPGAMDQVLTPADIATLNTQLAQMDDHTRQQAAARGYAFLSLGSLYDLPGLKPPRYSVVSQLTSRFPYGFFISADGVHPGPLGQAVIALAAAHSITERYGGMAVHATVTAAEPSLADRLAEGTMPAMALEWAKEVAAEHAGERLPPCLMPGGCILNAKAGPH